MLKIYKFDITDNGKVQLPERATILTVQAQHNRVCVWAEVDTTEPVEMWEFTLVPTGGEVEPFSIYAASVQLYEGKVVLHVYYK